MMSIGFLYWLLMIVWVVFAFWSDWPNSKGFPFIGRTILVFALFFLLGWKNFGPPIHG